MTTKGDDDLVGMKEIEKSAGYLYTEDGKILGNLGEITEISSDVEYGGNSDAFSLLNLPDAVSFSCVCDINWHMIYGLFLGLRTPKMKKWARDYRRCLHLMGHSKWLVRKKNVSRALKMVKKAKKRWGFIPY